MKTITIKDNKLIIKIPYDIGLVNLVKTSFNNRKWNSVAKVWECLINEKNILSVYNLNTYYEFTIFPEAMVEIEKYKDIFEEQKKVAEVKIAQSKAIDANIEIPNLKGELFPFQKAGVQFIENTNGKTLLSDEMGLGKTVQAIAWTLLHPEKRPILVICPATLKINWQREFKKWTDLKSYIINSQDTNLRLIKNVDTYIINYDIVEKMKDLLHKMNFQIIILDEAHFCFDGNTLITTNKGQVSIKEIVEKQMKVSVLSCNLSNNVLEWKYITNWFKIETPNNLIKVRMVNGEEFICTKEHKVWTKKGYKEVQKISCGEELFTMSKTFFNPKKGENYCKILWSFLCKLSSKFKTGKKNKNKSSKSKTINKEEMSSMSKRISIQIKGGKEQRKKKILWDYLCFKMENEFSRTEKTIFRKYKKSTRNEQREKEAGCFQKDERKQPNGESFNCGKNEEKFARKNFFISWGKWFFNKTTNFFIRNFKSSNRISYFNIINKRIASFFTNMLQSRFSNPPIKNCNRSRWCNTQNKEMEIFGQKKNRSLKSVRVESIEIYKSTSDGKAFNNNSNNKFVYDIEVADNHNYFASNILVSNCKNPKAKRTKAINELVKTTPHIIAITGTPILNRPVEIFNILKILSPLNFGNYFEFVQRYCGMSYGRWGMNVSGATNIEELSNKLRSTVMIRREKKDVLAELPDKTRIVVPQMCDLKEYRKVEENLISYLIESRNKTKLQAERSGQVEQLTMIEYCKQEAVKAKLPLFIEWAKDFIEENGKLVIFAHHKEFIERLMKELKEFNPVKIVGGMENEDKQKSIDTFMTNKNCKLIICSLKAAGVGITLTITSYVVFLELGWTPGDHDQAEDRLHRIGQKDNVSCYYFVAENTIEETIYNLIQEKRKIFTKLMQDKNIISEERTNIMHDLINTLIEG